VFFVCYRKEVSNILKDDVFFWPNEEELKLFIKDILEPEPVDTKYYLKENQINKLLEGIEKKLSFKDRIIQSKSVCQTLMARDYKEPKVVTIDTNGNHIPNIPEIGEANRIYDTEGDTPSVKSSNINIKSVQWDQSGKGHNSQEDRAYNADGVMCCIPNANPSNKVNIFALRSFPRNGTKEVDGERFQNPEFREDGCSNSLTSVEKDNMLMVTSTQEHNSIITDGISGTLPSAMGFGGGHVPMIGDSKFIDTYNHVAKDVCPTLTDPCHNSLRLFNKGIFRRLTPKECFRLQGFLNDEINLDGLSDTQRYKLCGNGQSVNVVRKIFERMFK